MSKSFGRLPRSRSRTLPPTRYATWLNCRSRLRTLRASGSMSRREMECSARGMIRGVTIAAHCSKLRPAYPQAPVKVGLSHRSWLCYHPLDAPRDARVPGDDRLRSDCRSRGAHPPCSARGPRTTRDTSTRRSARRATALTIPSDMDAARLVLGRALLERYRERADARDLDEARDALRAVDPSHLTSIRPR